MVKDHVEFILAERYLKAAGEWQDHFRYAKLADEHTFAFLLPG